MQALLEGTTNHSRPTRHAHLRSRRWPRPLWRQRPNKGTADCLPAPALHPAPVRQLARALAVRQAWPRACMLLPCHSPGTISELVSGAVGK